MSQFYQQPDDYQYPSSPYPLPDNQQPVGGFQPQPGQPQLGNQQPTGGFQPQPGQPQPGNQQPAGGFQPQSGYPLSGSQQPTGGFPPQPGYPPPGNQPPMGGFQPQPGSYPSPGNQPPMGGFQQLLSSFSSKGNAGLASNAVPETRPFGVTVASIAVAIIGGLNILLVLVLLGLLSIESSLLYSLYSSPLASGAASQVAEATGYNSLIFLILYYTVLGIGHLYIARGLWRLKPWAYWGVISIEAVTILIQLIILVGNHNGAGFFANIYVPFLIAGYLLVIGQVRRTFRVPF